VPSYKLDVNGDITTGTGNYVFSSYVASDTYQNKTTGNVILKNNANGYNWIIQADNAAGVGKVGFTVDPDLALTLNDLNLALNGKYISNDGGDEGIRIDNNGNVGIGTTSPDSSLVVQGTQMKIKSSTSGEERILLYAGDDGNFGRNRNPR